MQIDAQDFLIIAEKASHTIATFDIESSGLNCDYNTILVVSVKPLREKPVTFQVTPASVGDKKIIELARDMLHEYPVWISYYGRRFDFRMLQGRLLQHGSKPLDRHLHIDLYQVLKSAVNTSRRSMAHYSEWLHIPHKKMTLSPDTWNDAKSSPCKLKTLADRCESDVRETEDLYFRSRALIKQVMKQC